MGEGSGQFGSGRLPSSRPFLGILGPVGRRFVPHKKLGQREKGQVGDSGRNWRKR